MYKRSLFLLLLLSFSVSSIFSQLKPVFTSIELQPTVAYIAYKGGEARMGRLIFHGGKCYSGAKVLVELNGLMDSLMIPAKEEGFDFFDIPFPVSTLAKEVQATVKLEADKRIYDASGLFSPAKKWKVYVLPHSHVDIGYTNTQAKVLKLHMENIDESIALAEKTKNYPAGSRYKWNTEAIWVVDNYLAAADANKKKLFWDAVKNG